MSEPTEVEDVFARRIEIRDLDDPRLRPYWNLKERTLRGEAVFIAEGVLVVERLLKSPYRTESVLTTRKDDEELRELLLKVPHDVPIYYIDDRTAMKRLVGFDFHQGVLALGRRVDLPTLTEGLTDFFSGRNRRASDSSTISESRRRRAWVALPDTTKPDNLGLVFRCAAALDAEAVILGERCCDPFSRRALRVSMGGVLQTPIYQAKNLFDEILFAQKRWNLPFCATVLDEQATSLNSMTRLEWEQYEFMTFVFGNEYSGLSPGWVSICDRKMIIPMRRDVDSLNLGVSVGIFLYEFNKWN